MLYKHEKNNFKRWSKLFTKKKNKINTPISAVSYTHLDVYKRQLLYASVYATSCVDNTC